MEVEELRIKLVNKFCEEVKSTQEFNGVCDDLMESIKRLDYVMQEYFGKVYNAGVFKYVDVNSVTQANERR
jgi:hypothetical protein